MLAALLPFSAYASDIDSLSQGSYTVTATLSCYINAMGGIEFGGPLLTGTTLIVSEDGSKNLKLNFTKSSVTIYSITCDTFVDANPSSTGSERGVKNGTIGYYDKSGNLQTSGVTYTLSDDTALNSRDEAVNYVDSVTFPLDRISDTYNLSMYINSNVMGVQFCNENSSATEATYSATLTVDWDSVSASGSSGSGSSGTSTSSSGSSSSGNSSSSSDSGTSSSGTAESGSAGETAAVDSDDSDTQTNETVVDEDGLSIHYADGDSDLTSQSDSDAAFYVYLNMPALIGLAVFGGVLIVIGTVLLIIVKNHHKKLSGKEKLLNEQIA